MARCLYGWNFGEVIARCKRTVHEDGEHEAKTPSEFDASPFGDEVIFFKTEDERCIRLPDGL